MMEQKLQENSKESISHSSKWNTILVASLLGIAVCYTVTIVDVVYDIKKIVSEQQVSETTDKELPSTPKDVNDLWSAEDLAKVQGTSNTNNSFHITNKYEDISELPKENTNIVKVINKSQVYMTVDFEEPDITPLVYDERDGDEYTFVQTAIESAEVIKSAKVKSKGYARAYTPYDNQGYYLLINTPEFMVSPAVQIEGTSVVDWSTSQPVYFGGFGDDSEQIKEVRVGFSTSYFYESDYMREITKLQSISRTYTGTAEDDELKDNLLIPLDINEKGRTVYVQQSEEGFLQGIYIPLLDNRLVHIYLQGEDLPSRKDIVSALVQMIDTSEIVDSSGYLSEDTSRVLGSRASSKGIDINGFYTPVNEWVDTLLSLESEPLDLEPRAINSTSALVATGVGTSDKVLLNQESDTLEKYLLVDDKKLLALSAYHYTNQEDFEDPYEVLTRGNVRKTIPLYYKSYILPSEEKLLVGVDQLTDKILLGWLLSKNGEECTSIYFGDREGVLYTDKEKGTSYLLDNNKEDLQLLLSLLVGNTKGDSR